MQFSEHPTIRKRVVHFRPLCVRRKRATSVAAASLPAEVFRMGDRSRSGWGCAGPVLSPLRAGDAVTAQLLLRRLLQQLDEIVLPDVCVGVSAVAVGLHRSWVVTSSYDRESITFNKCGSSLKSIPPNPSK